MRWIVGLDMHRRFRGALQFAHWFRLHRRTGTKVDFVGVHVLDDAVHTSLPSERLAEVLHQASEAVARVADEINAEALSDLRVVWATSADEGLAQAAGTAEFSGLVVGRRAPMADAHAWVRLGTAPRRLLRHLPGPTMVVPISHGPRSATDPWCSRPTYAPTRPLRGGSPPRWRACSDVRGSPFTCGPGHRRRPL